MDEFLQYCNVISLKGGKMVDYDAEELFGRLQQVYVDRVVRNGFNDTSLYDVDALLDIAGDELKELNELGAEIAKTTNMEKPKKASALDIDNLTPEQRKKLEEKRAEIRQKMREARKKGKEAEADLTPEERAELERERAEKKKKRDERDKRITILRGISLRIPLLIYGAKLDDEDTGITIDNFTSLVDPASWEEFMPRGVTKQKFNQFKKCYNPAVFTAAGKRIRALAREADSMHIDDRIKRIAWIFSTFHNPDKETVLTPWRVVNMHMSDTLGGYCFFNEKFDGDNQRAVLDEDGNVVEFIDTTEPRFVDHGDVTENVFHKIAEGEGIASRVLEINSKTGLYPLYVTYTMYRRLLKYYEEVGLLDNPIDNLSVGEEQAAWDDVVGKNIYVICNTPMAASITRRTLMGFREPDKKLNIKADKLIERAKTDKDGLVAAIKSLGYWNGTTSKAMINFDAVVGNPPYQETNNVNNRQAPVYHYFYNLAEALCDLYTLISPARFLFNAGLTPAIWNQKMLNDPHLRVAFFSQDSSVCFPSVSINGGIVIILRNANAQYSPIKKFLPNDTLRGIASKFDLKDSESLKSLVFGGRSDLKFNDIFLTDFPNSAMDRLRYIQSKRPAVTELGPNEEYELKTSTIEALPYVFHDIVDNESDFYRILGLVGSNRVWKYVFRKYLSPRYPKNNNIEKHKVFISEADGAAGTVGNPVPARIIGKSEIGKPGDSATSTFISIGAFDTEKEAINCAKYLRTKFLRCLVGTLKITQHTPPAVWAYVPIQDFTDNSDIDWSRSISDIDRQLYLKYGLDMFEQEFIESHIQSME